MTSPTESDIQKKISRYVLDNFPTTYDATTLPQDTSLLELGILDSYGVIELVEYLEKEWDITILENEITTEKMGSIIKMARLVMSKAR